MEEPGDITVEIGAVWCRTAGEDLSGMPGTVEDEATLGEIVLAVGGGTDLGSG